MGILGNMLENVARSSSYSLGSSIGRAIGNAVGEVASQAADNVTTNMEVENERKRMALEEEKKITDLPSNCPNCGGPTSGSLTCEYCKCKIVVK